MRARHAGDHSTLEVDLSAIAFNWGRAQAAHTGARVGAVVKNDAYGLGLARIAPWLAELGCRDLWVSSFDEAMDVRRHLPSDSVRVFVLNGLAGLELQDYAASHLIPVLVSRDEVLAARRQAQQIGRPFGVAIHLDTGLTRVGLTDRDVAELSAAPDSFKGLEVLAWVSQLARFDTPDRSACRSQLERFQAWMTSLPAAPRSIAATMSVFSEPLWHLDIARVGSALYGVETDPQSLRGFQPAATLKAPILRVEEVAAGTAVGYGGAYRTPRRARLATLAIGYGSGLPFNFAERGRVQFDSHAAAVVGGVSMGLITADVTHVPEQLLAPGQYAEIFGRHQPVHQLATALGVTPNALLVPCCRLAGQRVYVHGPHAPRTALEKLQP